MVCLLPLSDLIISVFHFSFSAPVSVVMTDIVGVMFSKAFMEEVTQPQDMYSHRALRCVLTRLAHTSIMRLNSTSMDKVGRLRKGTE